MKNSIQAFNDDFTTKKIDVGISFKSQQSFIYEMKLDICKKFDFIILSHVI